MKTLCCVLAFSFATLSTFGQGTVLYQNTAGAGKEKYVYGFDSANPTSDVLGGTREKVGAGYSAQLFWGGPGSSEADLKPIEASLTTFKTGTLAGLLNGNSKLIIQGALGGTKVTLQLRAWDNKEGTITSWEQVIAASVTVCVPRGKSAPILNYELAGLDAEHGPHVGSGNLAKAGLQSFALVWIPEPSVIAMSTLGFCALLLRRPDRG